MEKEKSSVKANWFRDCPAITMESRMEAITSNIKTRIAARMFKGLIR